MLFPLSGRDGRIKSLNFLPSCMLTILDLYIVPMVAGTFCFDFFLSLVGVLDQNQQRRIPSHVFMAGSLM